MKETVGLNPMARSGSIEEEDEVKNRVYLWNNETTEFVKVKSLCRK